MNKSSTTNPIKILRAALLLLTLLLPAAAAMADDFITDVLVVGNKNQTEFNSLISSLVSAGWTDINQDLNQGCGGNSAYIHLLYKRQSSTAITGFYIRTGSNPPDNLTHEGHTYYLVPCQGSESFVNGHGDLNAGCGSGSAYIFLYYTKDVLSDNTGVTGITFNTTQSGAVGANGGTTGYDLNSGAGGAYIYMHLSTATGGNVVTLTSGSGNVQLLNGHILTGTGGANTQVSVTDGATVTFSGVNNTAITNNSSHSWPGIHCSGNATIVLNGSTTNSVKGGFRSPGIYVAANKTLTIQGSGTLNATGRDYAAGIGSGQSHSSCGNITISGGTVTATGGQNASGIGSGAEQQSCGNITISGGTVTATGLTYAAGIGSGNQSSCGTITISGGTVTATGGLYAAAIGSGYQSSCGAITITNGVTCVTATKHNNSAYSVGAGNNGSSVTVTIGGVQTGSITMSPFVTYPYTVSFNSNGGTGTMANQAFMYNVSQSLTGNAFTNGAYPFLGWATSANGPKVYNDGQSVINLTQTAGATVTLYAKWSKTITLASSTGEVLLQNGDTLTGTGGSSTRVKIADGATVTFSGVNNIAISNDSDHSWPGIHCLGNATIVLNGNTTNSVKGGYFSPGIYVAANKTLTIQGSGTLNATGRARGAAIGSGYQSSCGNITINSGTVNAIGGSNAAAIGSGYDYASCGDITISGGTVNATGGYYAAGIGSGCHYSSCGAITISGGTVMATGDERAAAIGSGNEYSSCGTINISGGTVTANGGQLAAAIGSGYYFASCGNITITNGVTRVTATKHIHSTNTIGAGGNGGTCGTITIGNVQQTEFITMSPFETYPYTVHFDANGGTGTMNDQALMNNVAQNLRNNTFTNAGLAFQGWATSANGPKVYNNGQSVSHLTDTIATVTLYAKWILPMSGNTYTINTATDWDLFCDMLAENDNGYFTDKTVKLADSISVTTMAGSPVHEFTGTFDGQSHTLTVSYQNTDSTVRTAPFSYVNGATIQNLIVAGSITGTANRAAGIVGETVGSLSHITNCVSSVNVSGGDYTGGISMGGNVEITGCVYNGMITGTSMSGGFVGSYNSALVISNSLFAPQAGSSISGGTFYYNGGGDITPVNSYYTDLIGIPQGKQARSIVGGEDVTVTFHGEATDYNTSGISAYSVGMVYDSTLYAGNGDTVSLDLSCTPPTGYVCIGYTANNDTLTGTDNPYTLAMPDAAVMIQALEQLTPVTYIDGDGEHFCDNFTMLEGGDTLTLTQGWYVANRDITYTGTLTLAGDVNLILCNGKTMTVTTNSGNSIYGLTNWNSEFALTVYGQTLDSVAAGTLYVTNNVVGKNAIDLNTYTQHSGNVVVNDSGDAVIHAGDFTINGGTINATGRECIRASNVTINGGTLTTNEIYSPTVTLGWSNTTDRITVGSFAYSDTPTVSVKSGQAFFYYISESDETIVVSDTLTTEEIAAIGGKTLRPYLGTCTPPFNLEVTDIFPTTAILHWMGETEGYNVRYYKPYFFDSFEEDLSEWTIYKEGDPASLEWGIENPHDNSADLNAHSGYYAAVAYSDYDVHADSWLVTPQIQFPNQTTLKFWIMRSTYDDAKDEYEVRISNTGNAISDFTTILKEKEAANPTWTEVSIDLSEYDGQQCYIAIRHDFTDGFFIMVDDFGIYGWSDEIVTTAESLLLEDLLPETEYQWKVQGVDCDGNGGPTEWSETATFTTLDENTKVFVTEGEWSDWNNWEPGGAPSIDENVILRAEAVVFDVAEANSITIEGTATLTIEDGGQLKTNNPVNATVMKHITGYGPDNNTQNDYYLFTTPIVSNPITTDPTTAGLITTIDDNPTYDLYRWDRTAQDEEWQNYKVQSFNMSNGTGYLYANANTVDLYFTGTIMANNTDYTVIPAYSEDTENGWNLFGNPFVCDAYLTSNTTDMAYYILEGEHFEATTDPVASMQGVFIQTPESGKTVTFSRTAPAKQGQLNLSVNQGNTKKDNVIVRFGEGNTLRKLSFFENSSKLFITMEGKDYAVVNAGNTGKVPVSFNAENNGTYTLSFNCEDVTFSRLRLIDHLTGEEIDLLAGPSTYTFDAHISDASDRFTLVYNIVETH